MGVEKCVPVLTGTFFIFRRLLHAVSSVVPAGLNVWAGCKPFGCAQDRRRQAVRRLVERGVLRLTRRSNAGHTVEVRLPEEIPIALDSARRRGDAGDGDAQLEATDFLRNKAVRQAIHDRERGFCFYCLRRIEEAEERNLDHVVPQAEGGGNSYRNLVSSCTDCNCAKERQPAGDFLRRLYREGRLTAAELSKRIRALHALAAGKLRPRMGLVSREWSAVSSATGHESRS
jgi:5-methylcytosine-specific restriction endonuclease McrA